MKVDQKRILIVDDDLYLSFIIDEMLEGCGYAAQRAETAEQAYDMPSWQSYHPVLLDVNLPDSTGFDICRQLRAASDVPIIFASARTAEDDRITGFDTGGDDFLPKPYSMRELLSRINTLIRRVYGDHGAKLIRFGDVEVNTSARSASP